MTGTLASGPPRVLIAEPNAGHARYIWQSLEKTFALMWTHTIHDTLVTALAQPPHIVVMEIIWPDDDGFALLQKLVAWRHAPTIVIMTSANTVAIKTQVLEMGADTIFVKDDATLSHWQAVFAQRLHMLLYVNKIGGGWRNPLFRATDLVTSSTK